MKKKGFTLIELLAVIIILGILMLIAIPSVTSYINNSRKETYITTAKELIKGAQTMVNSGELQVSDPYSTYYIPCSCIPTESGGDSPYGKFEPAYVVVTYTGDDYNYYWTSRDTAGMGVQNITPVDSLSKESITSGVDDITVNTGIDGKNNIILFNNDCSNSTATQASIFIAGVDNFPDQSPGTLKVNSYGNLFGKSKGTNYINKLYTVRSKKVPSNAIESWDASVEGDGSVMAWLLNEDEDSDHYEFYLGQDGGVKANPNSSYAFAGHNSLLYLDLSNLNTKDVTNMNYMFYNTGYNGIYDEVFKIEGLENWDTSKLETVVNMFEYTGRSAKEWNIGDISGWNTSNMISFSNMFYFTAYNSQVFDIGNIGKWNVSKATTMDHMFCAAGQNSKNKWYIGDLSNWDTRNVTNMNAMFLYAGDYSRNFNSIGTLKVYADNISDIFSVSSYAKATINIYSNPSIYNNAFGGSADANSNNPIILVNYSRNTTNIDNIIATRSNGANVVKGSLLD